MPTGQKLCTGCGRTNNSAARDCRHCGQPFVRRPAAAPPAPAVAPPPLGEGVHATVGNDGRLMLLYLPEWEYREFTAAESAAIRALFTGAPA